MLLRTRLVLLFLAATAASAASPALARDFVLVIGGGYAPSGNQASLEKNVLFFQRLLAEQKFTPEQQTVFFADGVEPANDLQVRDLAAVPKANRLMAEFFGDEDDLGMFYRNHQIAGVRASSEPANIRRWFDDVGPTMRGGDRLLLYVTSHGQRSTDRDNPFETSISLWDNTALHVSELVQLLDKLPQDVNVVAVMVQCYTGGFARIIYEGADPDRGLAKQRRVGFFATVHDRVAAGCTADVDRASYVEYSSYFWEAMGGRAQTGDPVAPPDYDGNGRVTFDEAHAYTVLKADTIDLPLTTSGEFLSLESQFSDDEHPDLLPDDAPYETVLALATPAERAVLEGLSQQLELTGSDRIEVAGRGGEEGNRRFGRRGRGRTARQRTGRLRDMIASDLRDRWPELSNVLNPGAIELLTTRSQEFVAAIEQHPRYEEYRAQVDEGERAPDPQKRRVKFERFVNTAEDVILRENLRRLDDQERLAAYQALVAAEATSLVPPAPAAAPTIGVR